MNIRLTRSSLAFRLTALIALWLLIALLVTGLLISAYFRTNAERSFQDLLTAYSYSVMGAVDLNEAGQPVGAPGLGDVRFLEPNSGWYWAVSIAKEPNTPLLHSRSLSGENLLSSNGPIPAFDDRFRRTYSIQDASRKMLQRVEAQLFFGESDTLYQVTIAGDRSQLEQRIVDFRSQILWFFSLFGLATLVALYGAVIFGLRPLNRAKEGLERVRQGQTTLVEGEFPKEISPLVGEINALIEANEAVIERARTQVGNLAHALKTPLAVILNDTGSASKVKTDPSLIHRQAQTMQDQIRHYLDRARVSAQRQTFRGNTEASTVIERLVRVMRKLNSHVEFVYEEKQADLYFAVEEQDLEEIMGNLLENAARHCEMRVEIACKVDGDQGRYLLLSIEDDGTGLSDQEKVMALKRGVRLDETQPGSGLGLAIVRDIAHEYGGRFELQTSHLGGLRTVVFLPRMHNIQK